MSIEQEIIDNALYYETDGKEQVDSAEMDEKFISWYRKIHQHFQQKIIPQMKERQENFVEYYPVFFLFGESSSYQQGISSKRLYRHTNGTYGTGYVCFTDKNIYITALDSLTHEFPLYQHGGSDGFILRVVGGLAGERDDRKPYRGDKTWAIDYPSILGAQVTQTERSLGEFVYIRTTTVDWQIYEHFIETLSEMLTVTKMGMSQKLANIWTKAEQKNSDVPVLLQKLNDLKEAGIITEAEF